MDEKRRIFFLNRSSVPKLRWNIHLNKNRRAFFRGWEHIVKSQGVLQRKKLMLADKYIPVYVSVFQRISHTWLNLKFHDRRDDSCYHKQHIIVKQSRATYAPEGTTAPCFGKKKNISYPLSYEIVKFMVLIFTEVVNSQCLSVTIL